MAPISRQDFERMLQPYLYIIHINLDPPQFAHLTHHLNLLLRWNQKLNLTSVTAPPEIVRRHFAESLFVGNLLPMGSGTLADIGSGAGFPGFPIAVLKPSVQVTLVESVAKKAAFLKELGRGFPNVTVLHSRFERLNVCFDCGVIRGLSAPDHLPALAARLRHLALILGREDASDLSRSKLFDWAKAVPLHWQPDRVVLLGESAQASGGTFCSSRHVTGSRSP